MKRFDLFSARSFGFAVISVAVAFSSAGCNLFGGGNDGGGGGAAAFTPTDAQVGELIGIAFGTQVGLLAASGFPAPPSTTSVLAGCKVSATGTAEVIHAHALASDASTDLCDTSEDLVVLGCDNSTSFTFKAGGRFQGGLTSNFGTSSQAYSLDVNGYFTGGFLGSENIQVNCVLKIGELSNGSTIKQAAAAVTCANAESDTMSCTVGSRTIGCSELSDFLNAHLPAGCDN